LQGAQSALFFAPYFRLSRRNHVRPRLAARDYFCGCAALFALEYRPFSRNFDEIGSEQ
jgi:hypothetical protein